MCTFQLVSYFVSQLPVRLDSVCRLTLQLLSLSCVIVCSLVVRRR